MSLSKRFGISEIFYSIQGEGSWTGTPSVFIRFAGCNVGCDFCDTDYSLREKLTASEIVDRVREFCESPPLITLTGGEPALQVTALFLQELKSVFPRSPIQVETSGSRTFLPGALDLIDFITLSPKQPLEQCRIAFCHDLKLLFPFAFGATLKNYLKIPHKCVYIQPIEDENYEKNLQQAIEFCLKYCVRLSIQAHKYIGVV